MYGVKWEVAEFRGECKDRRGRVRQYVLHARWACARGGADNLKGRRDTGCAAACDSSAIVKVWSEACHALNVVALGTLSRVLQGSA